MEDFSRFTQEDIASPPQRVPPSFQPSGSPYHRSESTPSPQDASTRSQQGSPFSNLSPQVSYAGTTPNCSQPTSPYSQGSTSSHSGATPSREDPAQYHLVQESRIHAGFTRPPASDPASDYLNVYQDVFFREEAGQRQLPARQLSGLGPVPVLTQHMPTSVHQNVHQNVHQKYHTVPESVAPARLVILEEPESEHRFRYASEGTSHGVLLGRRPNSVITVQLQNFANDGQVYVKATLYTADCQRKHFHKLKGKNCTSSGECVLNLDRNNTCQFSNLSVLRTENKRVHDLLCQEKRCRAGRQQLPLDDLMSEAKKDAKDLKLNLARIRFVAFDVTTNEKVAPAVFSELIVNTKSPLKITRISKVTSDCVGGKEIYLFCEAVNKKDIQVRFFETDDKENVRWEAFGLFGDSDVHHQVAIAFKTPPYRDQNLSQPVTVKLQLARRAGKETSSPMEFTYRPSKTDPEGIKVKQQKKPASGHRERPSADPVCGGAFRTSPSEPGTAFGSTSWLNDAALFHNPQEFNSTKQDLDDLFSNGLVDVLQNCLHDFNGIDDFMDLDITELDSGRREMETNYLPQRLSKEVLTDQKEAEFETDSTPSYQAYSLRLNEDVPNASIADFKKLEIRDYPSVNPSKEDFGKTVKDNLETEHYLEKTPFKPDFEKSVKDADTQHIFKKEDFEHVPLQHGEWTKVEPEKEQTIGTGTGSVGTGSGTRESVPVQRDTGKTESGEAPSRRREARRGYQRKLAEKLVEFLRGMWRQRVTSLSEALQRFSSSGDVKDLLCPLAELLGNKNLHGDTAIHLAVIHQPKNKWLFQQLMAVVFALKNRAFLNSKNNNFQTPLHLAVAVGEVNVVKQLLLSGADPNCQDRKGNTPLQRAVLKKDKDCLAVLLNKKLYNVRCKGQPLPNPDLANHKGESALHQCVAAAGQECLTLLLEAGADTNLAERTAGRTPLHLAVEMRSPLLSCLLQQSKTKVDAQDFAGNSALHLACSFHHHQAARLLVQAGANPALRNWVRDGKRERSPFEDDDETEEEEDEEDDDDETHQGATPADFGRGDSEMEAILAQSEKRERTVSFDRSSRGSTRGSTSSFPEACSSFPETYDAPQHFTAADEHFEFDCGAHIASPRSLPLSGLSVTLSAEPLDPEAKGCPPSLGLRPATAPPTRTRTSLGDIGGSLEF